MFGLFYFLQLEFVVYAGSVNAAQSGAAALMVHANQWLHFATCRPLISNLLGPNTRSCTRFMLKLCF